MCSSTPKPKNYITNFNPALAAGFFIATPTEAIMSIKIFDDAKRDSKGKVLWPNKKTREEWKRRALRNGRRIISSPASYSHEGQGNAAARRVRQAEKIAARKAATA